MLRLIENDLRMNAMWLFSIFVLLNLDLAVLARFQILVYGLRGIQVGFAFILPMALPIFLREESYKGQVVYRSIPVSRWKLVSARYLSVCLLATASVVYGWFYQNLIERFGPSVRHLYRGYRHMDAGYLLEHSLIARILGFCIVLSIAIPLIIRYGTVWRILIGFVVLLLTRSKGIDYLLGFSLHNAFFLGLSRWTFFVVVLLLAVVSGSFWLSVWLYNQRDL